MATNSDLKRQIDLLISSLERAGVNTTNFQNRLAAAGNEEERLVELMDSLVSSLDNAENSASSLFQTLNSIASELGGSNNHLKTTKSLYNKITNDARKLRDDEQGISDLSKNQLKSIQRRYNTNSKFLKEQARGLRRERTALQARKDAGETLKAVEEERLEQYPAAIKMAEDAGKHVADTGVAIKNRLDLEKQITKQMGVTGALVGGTGALMERLGMRSGIFHDAMEEANEEMREMAKLTADGVAKFSKLEIAARGFGRIASGFGQALFDPLTITTAIVSKFFELNAASTKLKQLTGQNAGFQAAHNSSLASGAQVMTLMAEMTERTGVAAAAMFSSDDLGRLAEAQNLLGLSSEQASNLGMYSKVSGTSIQGYKEELVASVNEFNAMNDSAVAHGAVMKDVLDASADISMSLGGNPKKIAAAASAARKLGLDLAKINQIADGLLEFESSIESELEAQLLTGKSINLSKARELALNNDLEGVANELAKNGASAAEFANMNRIQQDAMAKSMGMSREEMGKMLINQKGMNNLSAEQRAKMRGVTLEQLEQMEASEALKLAFSKIAEPLASILNALTPMLTMLAKAAAFVAPIAPYVLLAVKGFQMLNGGASKVAMNFGKMASNAKDFFKSVRNFKPKEFISGLNKSFGMGANKVQSKAGDWYKKDSPQGKMIQNMKKGGDKTKETTKKLADSSKATKAIIPGKNIKTFLSNLSQGLKSMAGKKVLQGALNLIPASLGLVAMIPGVLGAKLMEIIAGPKLLLSMQSMAQGLTAMGTGKVLLGTLGLTAAALAFTLMIPASAGMALMGVTAPMAAAGIFALIPALTALGAAMMTGVGAIGLAALVGLAVGLGAAFALMGSGAMMFGKGIMYAAQGVSSIFSQLSGLVSLIPSFYLLGGALMSIGAGLALMSFAGIGALPVLGALSLLAFAATPLLALGGLFGDGEGEEDNSMAEISSKLDTLISVVSAGGNVYLDGDKVGETQVLGTYKLS
jgi:hypothetical protein